MTYTLSGSTGMSAYNGSINIVLPPVLDIPVRRGEGPADISTCTALEPSPVVIWDPNYYYRVLGFEWPYRGITRKMILDAYRERVGEWQDRGDSRYLTLALSKLRDPSCRFRYDRLHFGEWHRDSYVRLAERLIQTRELAEKAKRGELPPDFDGNPQPEEAPEDDDSTTPIEPVVDEDTPLGDSAQNRSALSDPADNVPQTWAWGYYTWRSSCEDTERLYRWHQLLAAALRELDSTVRFAIGFVGQTNDQVVVGQLAGCTVAFLNEFWEPDEELAREAASNVRAINN